MSDIFKAIRRVGAFCDCREESEIKVDSLENEMKKLHSDSSTGISALGLIWSDPIYVYGKNTLFTDQLHQIGVHNAIDSVFSKPYPEVSREYFLSINPDVIYGPSFEFLDSTLFQRYPELKRVNAYQNRRIYEIDGDILTRPGPRSVEALSLLKKALHEE
jgi:iron complex transport system substrate-binding protein